jgi:hypothetical protein
MKRTADPGFNGFGTTAESVFEIAPNYPLGTGWTLRGTTSETVHEIKRELDRRYPAPELR